MKINNAEEEIRSLQLKHEFEIEVEKRAKKNLQQEKESIENELNISKQEVMALKSTVAKMTADSLGITTELQATKVVFVCLWTFSFLVWMLLPLRALNVINKTLNRLFHMHLFIDGRGRHPWAVRERRRNSEGREEKGSEMFSFSFEASHGFATRPRVLALESLHADYFIGRKGRRLFRCLKCWDLKHIWT